MRSAFAVVWLVLLADGTNASTDTWNGGGLDNLVLTDANWSSGQAPQGGESLSFAGSTRLTPTLNSALSIASISFASGAGAFVLGGTGTYTISTAAGVTNSSTNTETINNAITLGIAQTWSATSGNLVFGGNIANGGFLLTITGGSNTSASGIISGTGGLTKSGTGKLTLTGANSYTGATTVSAGCLNIQNATGLGTAAGGTTVSSGATLQLQGGITIGAEALNINGTGAAGQTGALVNVSGTNNYGGLLTLAGATTLASDSGMLNLTNVGTITGATFGLTLTGSGSGDIASIIGTTSGTLTKSGTGTWTLHGASTYTGATTISAGVLNIQNATGLGTTAGGTTVSTGAALQLQGGIAVGAEALTLNGGGIASDGALRNISGNNSYAGAITLGSASTINSDAGTLTLSGGITNGGFAATFGGAGSIVENGVISGTGALIKNDSGTLTLSGTNTFSGGSTLNGGTVIINSSSSLGASSGAATINAATLEVAATVSSTRNFTLGNAASTFMVDPTFTFTSTGVFSGTGALNKTGTGTLVLSGVNTYTGATAVNAGVLNIQNAAGLGTTAAGTTVSSGAALQLQGGIAVGAEALTLNGSGIASDGALRNISGNNSMSGAITLASATTFGSDAGTLTLSGTINNGGFLATSTGVGNITMSGVISGTGGLTQNGTGTLTLSGANTYTGATIVGSSGGADGGTLRLSGSGTISNATTMVFGGTLDLNGTTQSINNLALGGGASGSTAVVTIGAGNLNLGNNITYSATNNPNGATISGVGGGKLNLLGNRIFTVNDSSAAAADLTISAIIADGDATARQLTKAGAGTLVLTGINTYTGPTQVGASGADNSTAGTLQLSGSGKISNATATVVAGTLDLNGTTQTITNLNVSAGSSLAGSTATVNIGSGGVLNLGGNVVYAAAVNNAPGVGTISGGTLNLNGTRTFTVNDSTAVATDMSVSSVIADGSIASGLTKAGAGTLVLTGANTFSGSTTVSGGTLTAAASSGSALGSTSSITVNSGGTLLLGASEQIKDTAPMTLAGGTFSKGNFSEGTAALVGIGALTLTATGSHIDFGTGTVGVLSFASFNPGSNTLTIDNWTGTPQVAGSGSTDRLIFDSDQAANLSHFSFTGYGPNAIEIALAGGFFEITPVPEPATYIAGILTFGALAYHQRRRRLSS